MKRNTFNKALRHLKSTELDEKIQRLNEAPTNNIGGVYSLNKGGFRLGNKDPERIFYPDVDGTWPDGIPGTEGEKTYTRPAGYWDSGPGSVPAVDWDEVIDFSHSGTSTDGFIDATTGTVLSNLPPDSSSFILGPLVDGYTYNHGYDDYTNIGYIQKDTRQFILLGRIQGYWRKGSAGNAGAGRNPARQWGGESDGFTSYNENFTLAMAQWFRDQYVNGTYTKNVSYFYSGGQPQSNNPDPNAPPGSKGGIVGGAGNGGGPDDGPFGSGGDPNIGRPQDPPRKGGPEDAGFPWELFNNLKDWLFGKGKKKKRTDDPFGGPYGPAFGDDETANANRDELIGELERNMDQYGDDPKVKKAVDDWNDALYKAGGGKAAEQQKGQTRDDVIRQGRENLGLPPTPPPTSGDSGRSGSFNYDEYVKSLPPGVRDDMLKGGKTSSPVGDLAIMAATAAATAAAASGTLGAAKAFTSLGTQGGKIGASLASTAASLGRVLSGDANSSSEYNLQLAGKLAGSIISGNPQEIKLSDQAKKDQINSVDPKALEKILQIGKPPTPDANNAVKPTPGMKSDKVLKGGWADQGGVEVNYDPETDSLTITSNKMLRTGEKGDEFGKGQYGHPFNPIEYEKQTKFGDIPDLSPEDIQRGIDRYGLEEPLKALFKQVQTIEAGYGPSQMKGLPPEQDILNQLTSPNQSPDNRLEIFKTIASGLINHAAQGTASNAVALRKAMIDAGIVPPSEVEKTGGGHGQVYSQTSYKGNEIPPELRKIINNKAGIKESYSLTESRKRILREIKQPYTLPEYPKQKLKKYKPNFAGKYSPQNTPDVTACKESDEGVRAKNAAGQMWRTKDKYWSRYQSTERMNVIYDQVGHGDQYWEMIINENQNKKKIRDRKVQEHLNILSHERAMLKENPNFKSPFRKNLKEQETIDAPNDPLFNRVSKKLKSVIDYPDKPSKAGYPNDPPPEMVNGWHPEYGNDRGYYNKLDPQSAAAMPPTGNPEIDAKVHKAKRLKEIIKKKA